MKRIFLALLTGALMVGIAAAQDSPNPTPSTSPSGATASQPQAMPQTPAQQVPGEQPGMQPSEHAPQNSAAAPAMPVAGPPRLAPGSVIPVQLAKGIDAKKAKTGDPVEARVTQDLKNNAGDVVIPKDTKFLGHVTEAQARNKEQKQSQLGIAFDHAMTKTGEMQVPLSIQAIIGPQNSNPNNAEGGSGQPTAPAASAPNGMSSPSNRNTSASNSAPTGPESSGPTQTETNTNARPKITGSTQGVVGISNLTLAQGSDATQGSVMTSDKNNVKLESGTMMLLRVNQ